MPHTKSRPVIMVAKEATKGRNISPCQGRAYMEKVIFVFVFVLNFFGIIHAKVL
jgi:hypothetical protein